MRRFRVYLYATLSVMLLAPSARAETFDMSQIYTIDAAHSYLGFQVTYMGFAKVRGRMTDFRGTIRFDEKDMAATSVTALISAASINTEHEIRDKDLKSEAWLEVEKFPTITFQSSSAVVRDGGFDLIGDITIRDVTREIRLAMSEFSGVLPDIREDTQIIWSGTTTIDRREFGVEGERWSRVKEGITGVESDVLIELTILGKRINAPNFSNFVKNPNRPQGRVWAVVQEKGVDAGLAEFDAMRAADSEGKLGPWVLNMVGYMLIKSNRPDDAVTVFRRNVELFPDDGNIYDSLGEAYAESGHMDEARASYQTALEMDPENVNAMEILRHIGK